MQKKKIQPFCVEERENTVLLCSVILCTSLIFSIYDIQGTLECQLENAKKILEALKLQQKPLTALWDDLVPPVLGNSRMQCRIGPPIHTLIKGYGCNRVISLEINYL